MSCRISLHGKVLLLLGLMVILSTTGCAAPEQENPTPALEDIYSDQIAAVHTLSAAIENHTLYHCDQLLTLAASQQILNHTDPEVVTGLHEFYSRTPDSSSIIRLNENFTVVAAVPANMEKYLGASIRDPADAAALSAALTTHSVRIFELEEPVLENDRLMYGAPLKEGNATTGYLLAFSDAADYFSEMIQPFQNEHTEYSVWVTNGSGILLYASEITAIGLNISVKENDLFSDIADRLHQESSGIARYTAGLSGDLSQDTGVATWDRVRTPAGNMTVILASTLNSTALIPTPASTTTLSLQQFVQEAYMYVKSAGKEAALAEFNNPVGKFTTDAYYISAYDRNGTLIANPYMPTSVGRNGLLYQDENGVSPVQMYTIRAGQGGGSVLHVTTNPLDENQSLQMKHSYVLPVDDSWYLVGGEYLDHEPVTTNITEREQVTLSLRDLQDLMQAEGKDAVLAAAESYDLAGHPVVIMDTNGTLVVSPAHPTLVGTNYLGQTDVYGSSVMRDMIRMAHEGGGRQYVFYEGHLLLEIVAPLDDELFAVSGVTLI